MRPDENRERLRNYYRDVWAGTNSSKASAYMADNFQDHNPPPGVPNTREAHIAAIDRIIKAFPDMAFTYPHMLAEGDTVVGHWTMQGTHKGSAIGEPPSGKQVLMSGIDIARFEDGKIAELWHIEDQLSMLAQIGLLPPMGPEAPAGRFPDI